MLAEHTNQTSPDPTTAVVLPQRRHLVFNSEFPPWMACAELPSALFLLFHAQIGFMVSDANVGNLATVFRCGWVGVDIFFVLSGFLITGILLDTRHCGNYFFSILCQADPPDLPAVLTLCCSVFFLDPMDS